MSLLGTLLAIKTALDVGGSILGGNPERELIGEEVQLLKLQGDRLSKKNEYQRMAYDVLRKMMSAGPYARDFSGIGGLEALFGQDYGQDYTPARDGNSTDFSYGPRRVTRDMIFPYRPNESTFVTPGGKTYNILGQEVPSESISTRLPGGMNRDNGVTATPRGGSIGSLGKSATGIDTSGVLTGIASLANQLRDTGGRNVEQVATPTTSSGAGWTFPSNVNRNSFQSLMNAVNQNATSLRPRTSPSTPFAFSPQTATSGVVPNQQELLKTLLEQYWGARG